MMTAGYDLGSVLFYFLRDFSSDFEEPSKKHYPSLQMRRTVAKAYLDAVQRHDGLPVGCTRTSIDDIVYDMEIGRVIRGWWV
eukprot:SAG31_NODE_18579_length_631_cov_0.578947_1_plen_81_part_10